MANNPYLQDDDETQDELEMDAPVDSVPPSGSGGASVLNDYLKKRLLQADSDASAQKKKQAKATDIKSDLGFYNLLANAAADSGSLGGVTASAKPVEAYNAQLGGDINSSLKADEQAKKDKDMVNNYILDKANQQNMLQQKLDAQNAGLKTKKDLAETAAKNKLDIAKAGQDRKGRFTLAGTDDDGNGILLDTVTGKTINTKTPMSKMGKADSGDGSDPKAQKRLDDLGNMLTTGGRNASDFKAHQTIVTNADKILQTEPQMAAQKGGLDKRQIEEVAIASANLLSSGSGGAQATIQALVPHSYGSDAAGLKEWLSSEPQGTQQQAFVERMYDTAKREKHLAQEKLKGYRADMLGNYNDLAGNQRYDSLKNRYFTAGDEFDEQGNYKQKPFGMQDLGKAPQPGNNPASNSGQAIGAPGNQLPKTVIQNGHTYTLNPATGKYE